MTGEYVLWFDARSSASKRALEILREHGVEPELRRWLEEPPAAAEIEALLARLGAEPRDVVRTAEDEYQVLRLSDRTPREALVEAIARHPRLLDGPILVRGERAVLARPPERVLALVETAAPGHG